MYSVIVGDLRTNRGCVYALGWTQIEEATQGVELSSSLSFLSDQGVSQLAVGSFLVKLFFPPLIHYIICLFALFVICDVFLDCKNLDCVCRDSMRLFKSGEECCLFFREVNCLDSSNRKPLVSSPTLRRRFRLKRVKTRRQKEGN